MLAQQKSEVQRIEKKEDLEALMYGDVIVINGKKVMVNLNEDYRLQVIFSGSFSGSDTWARLGIPQIDGEDYNYSSLISKEDGSLIGTPYSNYFNTFHSKDNISKLKERGLL